MRLVPGGLDPLKRFALALERADLNDPSGMCHLGLARTARLDARGWLVARRGIGIGHRLRRRWGGKAGGRQDAENAVTGAVVGWLRRQIGARGVDGAGVALSAVGFAVFSLGNDRVRGFRYIGPSRYGARDRRGRLGRTRSRQLGLAGLHLDRLHRFGRAGDGGDGLGLEDTVRQRRELGFGLLSLGLLSLGL